MGVDLSSEKYDSPRSDLYGNSESIGRPAIVAVPVSADLPEYIPLENSGHTPAGTEGTPGGTNATRKRAMEVGEYVAAEKGDLMSLIRASFTLVYLDVYLSVW